MNARTENAIQTDASTQTTESNTSGDGEVAAVISPREAAMEAIASQRRQSLTDDGVDFGQGATDAAIAEPDAQLAAQLGQDERPSPVMFGNEKALVKVKIDGEELELPLSEVVKGYQKDQTASRRLTEATRLLTFAEQQASKVAQNEKQENNSTNQGESAAAEQDERRGQIRDAFTKLYEGDEDGAVEAMLKIVGASGANQATQVIDTTAIAAQVRQQLDVESAYDVTRQDYPDLFSNTERGVVLGKETYNRMVAKESSGIPRSQAMHEAAEEVAALFGIQKSGRQTTEKPRTARDTKLERKASLDIPSSANVVAGNTQSPAEAPNVSSVIAEMARSRLGQSLNAR